MPQLFVDPTKNKRHGDLLVAAMNSQRFKEIIESLLNGQHSKLIGECF